MSETATATYDVGELRERAQDAYRRLVRETAQGKSPNEKRLREVLWSAGKSLADFEHDLSRGRSRQDAVGQQAEEQQAHADFNEACAAAVQAHADYDHARKEAEEIIIQADLRRNEAIRRKELARQRRAQAEQHGRKLLEETADPAMVNEYRAAEAAIVQPRDSARALPERRQQLEVLEAQRDRGDFQAQPQVIKAAIQRATADVLAGEAAERALPELEERLRTLRARLLDPWDGMGWTG